MAWNLRVFCAIGAARRGLLLDASKIALSEGVEAADMRRGAAAAACLGGATARQGLWRLSRWFSGTLHQARRAAASCGALAPRRRRRGRPARRLRRRVPRPEQRVRQFAAATHRAKRPGGRSPSRRARARGGSAVATCVVPFLSCLWLCVALSVPYVSVSLARSCVRLFYAIRATHGHSTPSPRLSLSVRCTSAACRDSLPPSREHLGTPAPHGELVEAPVRVGVVAQRQSGHVERRGGAEPRPRLRARRGRRAVEGRAEVRRLCLFFCFFSSLAVAVEPC